MRYLSINLEGGRVLSHFDCFFSLFLMWFKQSWAREGKYLAHMIRTMVCLKTRSKFDFSLSFYWLGITILNWNWYFYITQNKLHCVDRYKVVPILKSMLLNYFLDVSWWLCYIRANKLLILPSLRQEKCVTLLSTKWKYWPLTLKTTVFASYCSYQWAGTRHG